MKSLNTIDDMRDAIEGLDNRVSKFDYLKDLSDERQEIMKLQDRVWKLENALINIFGEEKLYPKNNPLISASWYIKGWKTVILLDSMQSNATSRYVSALDFKTAEEASSYGETFFDNLGMYLKTHTYRR